MSTPPSSVKTVQLNKSFHSHEIPVGKSTHAENTLASDQGLSLPTTGLCKRST